jgi:hypothetical protein
MWSEIDFSLINIDEKDNITYNGSPLRFQIPVGYTDVGVSEWSRLVLNISNDSFFEWFAKLEDFLGKTEPFDSIIDISQNTINLKIVDKFSQFFNKDKNLKIDPPSIADCNVHVIMEITKKYGPFKDRYGLACRVYQLVYIPNFTSWSGTE